MSHINKHEISAEEFQTLLETDLQRSFTYYRHEAFDPSVPIKLYENCDSRLRQKHQYHDKEPPLMCYEITSDHGEHAGHVRICSGRRDQKSDHVYRLLKDTLIWCRCHGKKWPNTKLYVWVGDTFPFDKDLDAFPIFTFAKPPSSHFPLFPDNTFASISIDKKYGTETVNWNVARREMNEPVPKDHIIGDIYFRGTDTTNRNHNLRQCCAAQASWNVSLNAWKHNEYVPVWNARPYRYLLDLPGRYPWSNRFKYLLCAPIHATVIKVSVETRHPEYHDLPWISLIDNVVKPDVHYVNIPMTYWRPDFNANNPAEESRLATKTQQNIDDAIAKINDFVKTQACELEPSLMNQRRVARLKHLTLNSIYCYLYHAMKYNASLISHHQSNTHV